MIERQMNTRLVSKILYFLILVARISGPYEVNGSRNGCMTHDGK
jgi:hypothetical protein